MTKSKTDKLQSVEDKKDIGLDIWNRKYRYKGEGEVPADNSYEDMWRRVARAAAAHETKKALWENNFYAMLEDFRFLPGGRITANAGTARKEVTMFNCYVMNKIEDSIEGIFDTVKDAAVTQKYGGGVGYDFSTLRPRGSQIMGCDAESSGPVSFMQVLDSTCRTIMSAGQRRGAQMGVMRCDHPDIEEFIAAKRNNAAMQMFNLSVAITRQIHQCGKKSRGLGTGVQRQSAQDGACGGTVGKNHAFHLRFRGTRIHPDRPHQRNEQSVLL